MSDKDIKRFWSYVKKGKGCWEWQGGLFKYRGGYGQFSVGNRTDKNRTRKAHRVSFELEHGPVPKGQSILHSCDNPPCVRPSHLSAGTPSDNVIDMMSKGRNAAKLTKTGVNVIRGLLLTTNLTQEVIGKRFGVGQDTVSLIKHGKIWKHAQAA